MLIFEAQTQLKLFVIPKIRLVKYLHTNNHIPAFEKNIKHKLNKNIILKARKNTKPNN